MKPIRSAAGVSVQQKHCAARLFGFAGTEPANYFSARIPPNLKASLYPSGLLFLDRSRAWIIDQPPLRHSEPDQADDIKASDDQRAENKDLFDFIFWRRHRRKF